MSARCLQGATRSTTRQSRFALSFRQQSRNALNTSDSARKFPDTTIESSLKPWQRNFLIGGFAGLIVTQGYLYFESQASKTQFMTYSLVKKEPVSSTASIFHLQAKESTAGYESFKDAWKRGIWNVQFKQPQIQIVRAYTPLPPLEPHNARQSDGQQLRFLIRRDPGGEVSSYLHRLPIGADVELRGPNIEYELTDDVKQVIFLAGGTGIAPALQIAHAMFEERQDQTNVETSSSQKRKLHILWANRNREDCIGGVSDVPPAEPLPPKPTWTGLFAQVRSKPVVPISDERGLVVQELEALKRQHPGQVTVEYFVNTEDTWIDENAVLRALARFDNKDFSTGIATGHEQKQIIISGPEGFISHLAGPKEWRNGREEQGTVSKIIAHAISKNPHSVKVWKV